MKWPKVPLREVAPPKASTQPFPDSFVWHLSLEQIEGDTGVVLVKNYDYPTNAGTSTFFFDTGNVLYSKLRPYLNKVVIPDEPGIATTELIPLRPDPKVLNPRYLAFYLLSPNFVKQASHHVAGAKMPRVVMDWFWKHKIPLPPLSEQKRVVEILDEADRIWKLRREANQKGERIIPALFLKMFGDPATNPRGWPTKLFADIFRDTTAGNKKLQSKQFLEFGRIAVVDQGQSQIAGYTDDVALAYKGTFPVIVFGDHTRIFKFVDHPFVLGADGVRVLITKPTFNPLFAYWHCQLLNIPIAGYSRHFKFLKGKLFICPDRRLQDRFANFASIVTSQISALENSVDRVERLFSVMLDRVFSGKLTANWRKAHMKELLAEIKAQARLLNIPESKLEEIFQ
jgi:type I restriction enzyme S subunit